MLDHLGEHPFECRALQADRSSLDCKCLRAKGFYLEAVSLQFVGDLRKNHHLPGFELDQEGHQQPLPVHLLDLAIAQNLFKKNPLMCHMLVDDPKPSSPVARMKDSRSWPSGRSEPRWLRFAAACSASTWAVAACAAWMFERSPRPSSGSGEQLSWAGCTDGDVDQRGSDLTQRLLAQLFCYLVLAKGEFTGHWAHGPWS